MGGDREIRQLVDRALGCPDKGVINFNILHELLHEILNQLGDKKTEKTATNEAGFREETSVNLGQDQHEKSPVLDKEERLSQNINHTSSHLPKWDKIEDRLNSLEAKFELLNNLPSDHTHLTDSQQDDMTSDRESHNALALMWKFITLNRRVQATEEAVETIMNLLNGLIADVCELKSLRSDVENLQKQTLMPQKMGSVEGEGFSKDFSKISSFLEKFGGGSNLVSKSDLNQFVTWSALEQALNKKGYERVSRDADGGGDGSGGVGDRQMFPDDHHDIAPGTAGDSVDNVPARTAMSPKEFDKLTGKEASSEEKDSTEEGEIAGSLSSKESSFAETSLPPSDDKTGGISRENTQVAAKPSPQLIKQLSRIGELPKQYDDVAVQVSTMSELQSKLANNVHKVEVDLLPQKVDKTELNLPENLLEQIEMLKEGLDVLNANQDIKMLSTIKATTIENKENLGSLHKELGLFSQHLKRIDQSRPKSPETTSPGYDQDVLNALRNNVTSVQQEQEKMAEKNKEDVSRLLESLDEKQRIIDELIQYTQRLQEGKADRENVETEMNIKADKHALESKVNQSTFEETFEMFDKGLQEALQKMEDYLNEEMSLKDTLSRISQEMEGKIDNDSLNLMKEYFEKQIRDVQESRNQIARETHVDPTNAAGVRRKLPIHYHCISCDRPVELTVKDSEPALPGIDGLPLRRLKFPLTSYEVEQLRQKSGKGGYNLDETPTLRELLSGRPCGGSHTVVNSHIRRATKLHHFTNIIGREEAKIPKVSQEVSVLDFLRGTDGNYYKGRTRHVLPSLPKRPHRTTMPKHLSPESLPDQSKVTTYTTYRGSPSPPIQDRYGDDLSSSFPEKALYTRKSVKAFPTQQYSSDDINIPSATFGNRESIKILQSRRRRYDIKDNKPQPCWGSQPMNAQEDIRDKLDQDELGDSKSTSPKSIKRTTPVGQEEEMSTRYEVPSEEREPLGEPGQEQNTQDSSRTYEDTKSD